MTSQVYKLNSCVEDLFNVKIDTGEKSCSLTSKLNLAAEVSMAALFSTAVDKFNKGFPWYWLYRVCSLMQLWLDLSRAILRIKLILGYTKN